MRLEMITQRMRLFYLQLRSFYLRFVFLTFGVGTVSKEGQILFSDRGTAIKTDQTDFHREQEDQTEFQP